MVKILGICGSYKRGATYAALKAALEEAEKQGDVETKLIELKGRTINACIGCNRCIKEGVNACLTFHDDCDEVFDAIGEADGYIFASPVYGMGITPALSAVFSRLRPNYNLSKNNPDINLYKVGGAIAVGGTRNGGEESAVNDIFGIFHTKGITIVNGGLGAYSGGMGWSRDGGSKGMEEDETGMAHVRQLGRRVAKAAIAMKKGSEE